MSQLGIEEERFNSRTAKKLPRGLRDLARMTTLNTRVDNAVSNLQTIRTRLDNLTRRLRRLDDKVEARDSELEARHSELETRYINLETSYSALQVKQSELEARHSQLEERHAEMAGELNEAVGTLNQQRLKIEAADRLVSDTRAAPYVSNAPFKLFENPALGIVGGYAKRDGIDSTEAHDRRLVKDIFRGSESFIRERQRRYLELLEGCEPVLDAGCGRGEFLDLLREERIEYVGIDIDPDMLERCRTKGHEKVELADVNSYLEGLKDEALGAIFCAQVAEHLPYEELLRFFELSLRKLKPEGLLIVETVNPHSVAAMKTFWVDPSHQHPIFPEVALALSKINGFASAYVFHPNGSGDVEADRFREGEYAVVATKAPEGKSEYEEGSFLGGMRPLRSEWGHWRRTGETRSDIPIPPIEMRQLVGPTDPAFFDNPSGKLVFPDLPPSAYEAVFDLGCGCGRIARQLLQQRLRPKRYVGVDIHRGMIEWCRDNLAPADPNFRFHHHDVYSPSHGPDNTRQLMAPLEAEDSAFSLVIAWSVFTHIYQQQAVYYLNEIARIMRPDGIFVSTWFLFDEREFPMMQPSQNTLFINENDPTNAVIYDREWVRDAVAASGLALVDIEPPKVRGFHWRIKMKHRRPGVRSVEFPPDNAPYGSEPPPLPPQSSGT